MTRRTYPHGGAIRTAMLLAAIPLIGIVYVPIAWCWVHFFPKLGWPLAVVLAYLSATAVLAAYTKIVRIREETKVSS